MNITPYTPSKIYITKEALDYKSTERILSKLPHIKSKIVESVSFAESSERNKTLILAKQKGGFFKRCPGTQHYICCGYKILNLVNNCELNCSYCILQGYFNNPHIVIYVNIEDLFHELDGLFTEYTERNFRIGTGELADSLSTDHLTEYSKLLVSYFADKKNAVLELKTKTTQLQNFIDIEHGGRTIVAWSLNTPEIIAKEESQAPNLEQRLKAAHECQSAGFKVAFHFDPMIFYENWEHDYKAVVDTIFEYIYPQNIAWISLGALRYPPQLDAIIRENNPQTDIVLGELVPGFDGKLRYFKPIRIKMFRHMYHWIKQYDEDIFIYLCMESSEVYQKAFGWTPRTSAKLSRMMNKLV